MCDSIGNIKTGVLSCPKLKVFREPTVDSEVVCKLYRLSEVMIDESESTTDFYRIYTASGLNGYCRKDKISIM